MSAGFAAALRGAGGLTPGRDGMTKDGRLKIGGRPGELTADAADRQEVLRQVYADHAGLWENPPGLIMYGDGGMADAAITVERTAGGSYAGTNHGLGFEAHRAQLRRELGFPLSPAPGDNDALAAILAAAQHLPPAGLLCRRAGRAYQRSAKNAAALAALKQELADCTGYSS